MQIDPTLFQLADLELKEPDGIIVKNKEHLSSVRLLGMLGGTICLILKNLHKFPSKMRL